ncbi:MAG TPA: ring-opening amidohydrolase [Solirubrobacteraceae bacterium]|jgi:cyanuric acid amidohydrolase|nr:ring-opening amidohydrolase [Solirubrobacteraceae bacterium]
MSAVQLIKAPTEAPDDLGPVAVLEAAGLRASDIIALVAKSEGNGCVNDFSRTLTSHAWRRVLPDHAISVVSGGTEGVLSPHVTLVAADRREHAPTRGLCGQVARTPPIPLREVGRTGQLNAVAAAVGETVRSLGATADEVHLVLVKCPLLTTDRIARCIAAGESPVSSDAYESMACSRRASALGVAVALGECSRPEAERTLEEGGPAWSSVASVSSGAELDDCQLLVLAGSAGEGRLRACRAVMTDALDMASVAGLLAQVAAEGGRVVQLFAKAEADPTGRVRGRRHTMLTDSDIHSTRHARAAVGGLLAAMVGDSCVYVSGGAEAQGPPGGGPVTIVYEVPGG